MKNEHDPSLSYNLPAMETRVMSADTLQKLIDFSLDVICSIDEAGRFVTVSAAATDVWGYYPEELEGRYCMDLILEEDKPITYIAASNIMAGINMTNFENRYMCKDGSIKPILWSARWDSEEKMMYCVAKDASEKKRAEEQFKLQERRLFRAYKLAGIAWWEYDVARQVYTSSDEIYAMYGRPVAPNNETTLQEFLSYVHPDDVQKLYEDIASAEHDTYVNYEHRIVKPDGDVIYVMHYTEVLRDKEGNAIGIHGSTKDVTKNKIYQLQREQSEAQLQQYSQKLTDIIESIGDVFFTLDKNWIITYWNKKAENILGRSKEEMVGKNIWEEFQEATHLKFYTEYHRAVSLKTTVLFEEFYPPLNMWIEVNAYPSNEGLSVYFKDISYRKEQETKLKISNERYEFVTKATSDAIWDWDIINKVNYFNDAFTNLFGHSNTKQSVSDSWSDRIHKEDKERILIDINAVIEDPTITSWSGEYRFVRANGSIAYVYDRGIIIRDNSGAAIRMVGSMQDITRIKETEKEMAKAIINAQERERSDIGKELHDNVNQLLTTVKLYIENIRDYPDHRDAFIEKGVQLSQRAINEIRFLAKQLVTPVMADLGFKATLDELVDHYRALQLFEVEFDFSIEETRMDKNMQLTIFRIIQEQLNNIVKYAKASLVKISIAEERHQIIVRVEDNGEGFDVSKVTHGLGLNNIRNRAELFKGKLLLQSAEKAGCMLLIHFPMI